MYKDFDDLISQQEEFLSDMKEILGNLDELGSGSENTLLEKSLRGNAIRLFEKLLEHAETIMLAYVMGVEAEFDMKGKKRFFRSARFLVDQGIIPEKLANEFRFYWDTRNRLTHEYHPVMDEFVLEKCPGLLQSMEEFVQHISRWRAQWT